MFTDEMIRQQSQKNPEHCPAVLTGADIRRRIKLGRTMCASCKQMKVTKFCTNEKCSQYKGK